MKGNIKKLVLLIIITVIAPFILAVTVTGQPVPQAIKGQYAATGGGTFLTAVCGFGNDYIPNGAAQGAWAIESLSIQAVFTFERDGTGTVSETHRVIDHYSIAPSQAGLTPTAGIRKTTYSFAYTVEQDGMIKITADPDTIVSTQISGPNKGSTIKPSTIALEGTISPDGKTIVLNGGLPDVATLTPRIIPPCPKPELIGNISLVLIWQHGNDQSED
jgi:hypothetical protein